MVGFPVRLPILTFPSHLMPLPPVPELVVVIVPPIIDIN
jgi:hypothetical protein